MGSNDINQSRFITPLDALEIQIRMKRNLLCILNEKKDKPVSFCNSMLSPSPMHLQFSLYSCKFKWKSVFFSKEKWGRKKTNDSYFALKLALLKNVL